MSFSRHLWSAHGRHREREGRGESERERERGISSAALSPYWPPREDEGLVSTPDKGEIARRGPERADGDGCNQAGQQAGRKQSVCNCFLFFLPFSSSSSAPFVLEI